MVARVANPVLNALCVNASEAELAPIVYEAWPAGDLPTGAINETFWQEYDRTLGSIPSMDNQTVLDSFFGWRDESEEDIGSDAIRPGKRGSILILCEIINSSLVFMKYPTPGNTASQTHGNRAIRLIK